MEKRFSKDEILEMYLNTIYFGSNAYGIENASKTYFGKSAKDLSLNEVCCLAGMIKSPKQYSPKTNLENCNKRKNVVAKAMLDAGDITKAEYDEVVKKNISLSKSISTDNSYETEAIFEACKLLNISERDLINQEYKILTFKDENLQNEVLNINNNIINEKEKQTETTLDSLTAVVDKDGKMLAYYVNSNYDLHNLRRQPASTLKPFAVYLPCLIHNILTPASEILDEEINYNGFSPKNADKVYHGYVSTRFALANSLNVPAVKALEYAGIKNAKSVLNSLGLNLSNSDYNLSLALGATKNGISVLDMLACYNCLANMGEYRPISFVDKILDKNGNVVYSHEDYSEKIIDAESCFLLNDMLKDTAKTGTAKRLASLSIPVASKTGTASVNEKNTDLFNYAFTSEHTLVSWVADISNTNLNSSLKSSVEPTQINKEILSYLYSTHLPNDFPKPEGIELMPYDSLELKQNHIIVAPTTDLDRYIQYDYFKMSNPPETKAQSSIDFNVNIDKFGAKISFQAKENKIFNVIRKTKSEMLLSIFENTNEKVVLTDRDIFSFDRVEYYIEDENGNKITEPISIYPKDFLINMLNNEILKGKKKWLVNIG